MKKSIVTAAIALGLAASASAASLSDAVYSNTNVTSDTDTVTGLSASPAFTLTATLDVSALASAVSSTTFTGIFSVCQSGTNYEFVAEAGTNPSNSSGIYAYWGGDIVSTGTTYAAGQCYGLSDVEGYSNASTSFGSSFDWSDVTAAALTMTATGNSTSVGTYFYLTLTYSDDTTVTYAGYRDGLRWSNMTSITDVGVNANIVNSVYLIEGVSDATTAISLNTAAITAAAAVPEPATATLSLLALAGLAARRRRK